MLWLFPGIISLLFQSNKKKQFTKFVISQLVQEYLPASHRLRVSASSQGPTNPEQINFTQETLGFRRECLSHSLSLLMSAFALLIPPIIFSNYLQRLTERSATQNKHRNVYLVTASVNCLSPVTSSSRKILTRPVSCYAIFKGWLLLSQPPGCLGFTTYFPTQQLFGDLSW